MRQAVKRKDSLAAALLWLETPYMTAAMEQPGLHDRLRRLATENASSWVPPDREKELEPPAIGRLQRLVAPTLVIVGSRDIPDIHRIVDTLVAQLPHVRLVRLEGAGHMVNLEQPERFSRTVLEFLRAP